MKTNDNHRNRFFPFAILKVGYASACPELPKMDFLRCRFFLDDRPFGALGL